MTNGMRTLGLSNVTGRKLCAKCFHHMLHAAGSMSHACSNEVACLQERSQLQMWLQSYMCEAVRKYNSSQDLAGLDVSLCWHRMRYWSRPDQLRSPHCSWYWSVEKHHLLTSVMWSPKQTIRLAKARTAQVCQVCDMRVKSTLGRAVTVTAGNHPQGEQQQLRVLSFIHLLLLARRAGQRKSVW